MATTKKLVTLDLLTYFKQKLDTSVDEKITSAAPWVNEDGFWVINSEVTNLRYEDAESIPTDTIKTLFVEDSTN